MGTVWFAGDRPSSLSRRLHRHWTAQPNRQLAAANEALRSRFVDIAKTVRGGVHKYRGHSSSSSRQRGSSSGSHPPRRRGAPALCRPLGGRPSSQQPCSIDAPAEEDGAAAAAQCSSRMGSSSKAGGGGGGGAGEVRKNGCVWLWLVGCWFVVALRNGVSRSVMDAVILRPQIATQTASLRAARGLGGVSPAGCFRGGMRQGRAKRLVAFWGGVRAVAADRCEWESYGARARWHVRDGRRGSHVAPVPGLPLRVLLLALGPARGPGGPVARVLPGPARLAGLLFPGVFA